MRNMNTSGESGEVDVEAVLSTAFWLGVVGVVACGAIHIASDAETSTDPREVKQFASAAESCMQPRQDVPTRLTMPVTRDTRRDMIYACNYFNDIKLPANKKLALGEVTSETFDRNVSDAKIEGSFGAFLIIAAGHIEGASHSDTVRERLYLVNIKDSEGNYVFTTLDKADKVRVNQCIPSKTCTPSIEFKSDLKPLWFREPGKQQHFPWESQERDTTSIWQANGVHQVAGNDDRREYIVSQLVDKNDNPLPPGQIATTLSNEIVITIPKK